MPARWARWAPPRFFPPKTWAASATAAPCSPATPARAALLQQLANHGQSRKYHHQRIGLNSRLDTLQAALLRVKLRQLPANTAARQAVAARYDAALAGVPGLHIPARDPRSSHVFHQYTITAGRSRPARRPAAPPAAAAACPP